MPQKTKYYVFWTQEISLPQSKHFVKF